MATTVTSLPMSQTKEGLRRHLNMPDEIYTLMAKEADRVYKQLTTDKRHLKSNCKGKPPYDWNDVVEKSKDDAMVQLARNGSSQTAPYWHMAEQNESCPNWIAKWFLYHKFRYRDGRNKSKHSSSHKEHKTTSHRHSSGRQHHNEDDATPQPHVQHAEYSNTMTAYTYDGQCYTTVSSPSPTSHYASSYGDITYANNRTLSQRMVSSGAAMVPAYPLSVSGNSGYGTQNPGKKIFDPVKDDWVHNK